MEKRPRQIVVQVVFRIDPLDPSSIGVTRKWIADRLREAVDSACPAGVKPPQVLNWSPTIQHFPPDDPSQLKIVRTNLRLCDGTGRGEPAPSWLREAIHRVSRSGLEIIDVSHARGEYFASGEVDEALQRWLNISWWYKHQGAEREMFYRLIRTFHRRMRKHRSFEDFWPKVARAVRENYPDSQLHARTREAALTRCYEEALVIFAYEDVAAKEAVYLSHGSTR